MDDLFVGNMNIVYNYFLKAVVLQIYQSLLFCSISAQVNTCTYLYICKHNVHIANKQIIHILNVRINLYCREASYITRECTMQLLCGKMLHKEIFILYGRDKTREDSWGTKTAYPSGASEFITGSKWGSFSSIFSFLCNVLYSKQFFFSCDNRRVTRVPSPVTSHQCGKDRIIITEKKRNISMIICGSDTL
jgi:hypothetical protein